MDLYPINLASSCSAPRTDFSANRMQAYFIYVTIQDFKSLYCVILNILVKILAHISNFLVCFDRSSLVSPQVTLQAGETLTDHFAEI